MSKRKPYLYVAQQVAHDRAEVSALEVGNMFVDQMYILYEFFAVEPVLIGVVSVVNLTI